MKQSPVAIIGPSRLFREGLQGLLRRSRFLVVSSAPSLEEAIGGFVSARPELAICLIPTDDDVIDCVNQLRMFRTEMSGIRIVLLIDMPTGDVLRDASAAGAQAVLSKDITGDVLQRSLELVMLGQQLFPGSPEEPPPRPAGALIPFGRPSIAPAPRLDSGSPGDTTIKSLFGPPLSPLSGQRSAALSERERQILRCLVEGAPNKAIARDLQITEATVKVHIKGLLRKIRVNNRTQAAVWGMNNTSMMEDEMTEFSEKSVPSLPIRHAAF